MWRRLLEIGIDSRGLSLFALHAFKINVPVVWTHLWNVRRLRAQFEGGHTLHAMCAKRENVCPYCGRGRVTITSLWSAQNAVNQTSTTIALINQSGIISERELV